MIAALLASGDSAGFTPTYGVPTFMGFAPFEPDASVYTIDPAAMGTPHPHRKVAIFFASLSTGSTSTVSVVASGVTATVLCGDGAGNRYLGMFKAAIPTDAPGGIVVTRSDVTNRAGIAWFVYYSTDDTVNSVSGATPTTSSSANSLALPPLTVPVGGFAMAAAWVGTTGSGTWSQTTGTPVEAVDATIGSGLQFSVMWTTEAGAQVFTADFADAAQYRVGGFTWKGA